MLGLPELQKSFRLIRPSHHLVQSSGTSDGWCQETFCSLNLTLSLEKYLINKLHHGSKLTEESLFPESVKIDSFLKRQYCADYVLSWPFSHRSLLKRVYSTYLITPTCSLSMHIQYIYICHERNTGLPLLAFLLKKLVAWLCLVFNLSIFFPDHESIGKPNH